MSAAGFDAQQARIYLDALHGGADTGTLALCTPAGDFMDVLGRYRFGAPGWADALIQRAAASVTADLYVNVNPVRNDLTGSARGGVADTVALHAVHMDLDAGKPRTPGTTAEALDMLEALALPPSLVTASGSGGVHAYWALREPWVFEAEADRTEAAAIVAGWRLHVNQASGYTFDSVQDLARVLRLPGTINHKRPPGTPVRVLVADGPHYNPSDFEPYLPIDQSVPDAPHEGGELLTDAVLSELAAALVPSWGDGYRHHMALHVAGWLACHGIAEESARALVARCSAAAGDGKPDAKQAAVRDSYATLRNGTRPAGWVWLRDHLPEADRVRADRLINPQPVRTWDQLSKATVTDREKVSVTGETAVTESNEPMFRTAREIVETVPAAMPWLCYGLVARGVVTEIDGAAKRAGKTTFLMAMIAAMRSGSAFLELATKPAGVVYLSEQTPGTIRGALMRAGLGEAENLHLMSYADTKGKPWSEIAALAVAYALEAGACLLVVDTLPQYAGLQGESENHSGAALAAMLPLQLAAGAGLAVVAVRHDRKGGGAVGESGRGSSAYAGAVDIVAQLAKPDGFTRPGIRHLSTVSRFDESPESLVFELTDAGYIVHDTEAAVKTKEARAAILAALPELETDALTRDELAKEAEVTKTLTWTVLQGLIETEVATRYGSGNRGDAYRFARFPRPVPEAEKPPEKLSVRPKNVVLTESFLNSDSVLMNSTDSNHREPETEPEKLSVTTSNVSVTETISNATRRRYARPAGEPGWNRHTE